MREFLKWLKDLAGSGSPVSAAFVAFVAVAGCAAEPTPAPAADAADFAVVSGALGETPWLYFGAPATGYAAKGAKVEFQFHAKKGKTFQVLAKAAKPGSTVTASLYKQKIATTGSAQPAWTYSKKATCKDAALVAITPSTDGTYRVVVAVTPVDQSVTVTLTCLAGAGQCATFGAPGAGCGSRGMLPCDTGLYCAFPIGAQCGWTDKGGTCAVKPQICMMNYAPVCGCDGKTYSNACAAAGAGTGLMATGPCAPTPPPCDAKAFLPAPVAKASVVGEWNEIAGSKPPTTYGFASNGTFNRTDAVAPCPAGAVCFWSGLVQSTGTWSVSGATVQLTWQVKAPGWDLKFPASLIAKSKCKALQLQENGGAAETFAPAPL